MTQRDTLSPRVHIDTRLYWVRDMHAPLSNWKARDTQTLASAGGDTHWKYFIAK